MSTDQLSVGPNNPYTISGYGSLGTGGGAVSDGGTLPRERQAGTGVNSSTPGTSKLSRNGVRLHPQPTTDPLDPLNWAKFRKHIILGIVMWLYFMFAYIVTTIVPSFPQIQKLYHISYSQANMSVALPSIGLALGPLFWSSLADIYGRRIIFIIGTTISFAATVGTAISKNYGIYMASRAFQGLGVSPAGTVGMAIIGDLFFDYERGQKLGLWALAINSGAVVGPMIGGAIAIANPLWVNWLIAIQFGVLLILELAFLPETLYPRNYMLARSAVKESDPECDNTPSLVEIKRTVQLPFFNLKPVPGMRHPKPWESMVRFGLSFQYPVIVLPIIVYCFAWYWWVASLVAMIPDAYSMYVSSIQGLLFIGLLLGTLFAELTCSGTLSDWIVHKSAERNEGIPVTEARLWLSYPAALLAAIGLVIWGVSIGKQYHWIVGQIGFFLFALGLQMGNTVILAYVIDCYPLQSMSVITYFSVWLDISVLINPVFIANWVAAAGYIRAFIIQGIITFGVSVPVIALMHRFGPKIREWSGKPPWVNPEYDALF